MMNITKRRTTYCMELEWKRDSEEYNTFQILLKNCVLSRFYTNSPDVKKEKVETVRDIKQ